MGSDSDSDSDVAGHGTVKARTDLSRHVPLRGPTTLDEDFSHGLIYVCLEDEGGYAKIGWASSVEHAYARWGALQTGNPRLLTLSLVAPGDITEEAALHRRHQQHYVRGEWFRVEGSVEQLVHDSVALPKRSREGAVGRPPTEREAAQLWLKERLALGPTRAQDVFSVARVDGHSQKTIRRAADDLGVLRVPPGGGTNCKWELPMG
ncbi:MAG: hypothetical protein M3401_04370 [Actinomycetota bacterium]|nr:hypothetical protein [Actinomycetota bacterium]